MPAPTFELRLRPATLDDAAFVADLESLRDPTEPRDPVLLRHWWQMADENEVTMRRIDVRDGAPVAYVGASHERWEAHEQRFGAVRHILRADMWSEAGYVALLRVGEDWLRGQGATTSVVRVREDFEKETATLERIGYREDRRTRISELDLVANGDRIRRTARETVAAMEEKGIRLMTVSEDPDPEKYQKLYETMIESERDIPVTVPWRTLNFDEWHRFWFDNPVIRQDRFWIAREGDAIVGMSILDTPAVKGVPWTAYTGTSRSARGRGIARALKYQSMAQAIDDGFTRVRTNNDADNPPILHINQEMGYRLIAPVIEFHGSLD